MEKTKNEILDAPVVYKGEGISVRLLEESIAAEREYQNANIEELDKLRDRNELIQQALREEVKKLRKMSQELSKLDGEQSFWDKLNNILGKLPLFKGQAETRRSVEELLRAQYEISAARLKEAAEFADRLQAAESDLFDELERLNRKIVESSQNEDVAAETVLSLQNLKEDLTAQIEAAEYGSTEARKLEGDLDRCRRSLAQHSTFLKLYSTAEDRLVRLQQNTRQLADTIARLRADITVYVTAASEKLDLIAGQVQAIGAAADASVVMLELKASLDAMTESINEATRFVSETQTYFRQNVDTMLEELDLYDDETAALLDQNLALSDVVDDDQIAEALGLALARVSAEMPAMAEVE